MLGIPVSSTLQSAVKQVAISSGQIVVAKGNPSVSKVMGGKQVLAQGVAKAIVSGASGIAGQQPAAKAAGGSSGKSGGQSSHTQVHMAHVTLRQHKHFHSYCKELHECKGVFMCLECNFRGKQSFLFFLHMSLVMATLQLPANNLANLANLPPGTKLYLTTNSKNPSGKGKLLLIPQGAILRASGASKTCYILHQSF